MNIHDIAERLYTSEAENERLLAKLRAMGDAIMNVAPEPFSSAHRTPLWMEGFMCGKIAAAAEVARIIGE